MDSSLLTIILLGIVEGVTEFIPVSSTGHLILASELLGYNAETWATFNVIIQLGAILAVVYQYFGNFWSAGMKSRGPVKSSMFPNSAMLILISWCPIFPWVLSAVMKCGASFMASWQR